MDPSLIASSLHAGSSPARLIICERSGSWSAVLRGELAETGLRLWECRSLPETWEALAETPAAFVIAEATRENVEDLLRRMAWFSRDFPALGSPWWLLAAWAVSSGCCARRERSIFLPRRAGWGPWPAWPPGIWPMCRCPAKHSRADLGNPTLGPHGNVKWFV